MVATHIFHKLVFSARLFMKKASWGCCILVFDSSGEPPGHPEFNDPCAPGCSGTVFEVGRITSCEDSVGATVHAPMGYDSSMIWSTFYIRRDLSRFHLFPFSGPMEVPAVEFGDWDISTETETRRQRRSRSARTSRRLVPLARGASASVDFTGRHHNRMLLESTMVCINWNEDFPSGVPRRFLNFVLFQTTFPPILLSRQSMRQVTSWSVFVNLSVLRNENKFLTPLWRVSITHLYCHTMFSFLRVVCSSANVLLTLVIFVSFAKSCTHTCCSQD